MYQLVEHELLATESQVSGRVSGRADRPVLCSQLPQVPHGVPDQSLLGRMSKSYVVSGCTLAGGCSRPSSYRIAIGCDRSGTTRRSSYGDRCASSSSSSIACRRSLCSCTSSSSGIACCSSLCSCTSSIALGSLVTRSHSLCGDSISSIVADHGRTFTGRHAIADTTLIDRTSSDPWHPTPDNGGTDTCRDCTIAHATSDCTIGHATSDCPITDATSDCTIADATSDCTIADATSDCPIADTTSDCTIADTTSDCPIADTTSDCPIADATSDCSIADTTN